MSHGVVGLVAVLVIVIGPLALVLALLNARDRRRDRAGAVVLSVFNRRLISAIELHVRAPLLSRRTTVVLDMSCCGGEVWPALRQLASVLPPDIALVVLTQLDGAVPVTVTLRRPVALPA